MEIEITDLPELTGEQTALIDMHSVVNIRNVLVNELEYLQEVVGDAERLQPALDAVQQVHLRLRSSDDLEADLDSLLKRGRRDGRGARSARGPSGCGRRCAGEGFGQQPAVGLRGAGREGPGGWAEEGRRSSPLCWPPPCSSSWA